MQNLFKNKKIKILSILFLLSFYSCSRHISFPIGTKENQISRFYSQNGSIIYTPTIIQKNGIFYIKDDKAYKILKFSKDGKFISSINFLYEGKKILPDIFLVNSKGFFYTTFIDSTNSSAEILKFSPKGDFLQSIDTAKEPISEFVINDSDKLILICGEENSKWIVKLFVDDVKVDETIFDIIEEWGYPSLILPLPSSYSFIIEWRNTEKPDLRMFKIWDGLKKTFSSPLSFNIPSQAEIYTTTESSKLVFIESISKRKIKIYLFDENANLLFTKKRTILFNTIYGTLIEPLLFFDSSMAELRATKSRLNIVFF